MYSRVLALILLLACQPACAPEDAETGVSATHTSTAATTTDGGTGGPGTTTSPTTTEPAPAGPECGEDADCRLVNNCCECDPKPIDAEVAPCGMECIQSTCDALGLYDVQVACRSGICEFADVTCSDGPVDCDAPKPDCGDDRVNTVRDGCWGACMHPRYCEGGGCTPGSCGDGWTCVGHQSGASTCARLPAPCAGAPSCACLEPYFDEFCPGSCGEDGDGVVCEDGG